MVKNNFSLSICIPTFNRASYLSETIQSILSQTYTNFELVIINDGCTDNTDSIVESYRDKRVRYFKNKKNLGYIKTMNKATMLSKAEWVMHVSDDDRMMPTMLEEMIEVLSEYSNQEIGFVVPQSVNINEKGELINEPEKQLVNKKNILLKPKEFIFNFTLYGRKIHDKYVFNTSFPSTLFNKRILIELGMSSIDVPVSHDILIESKICLLYPILVVDKPLFEYRIHENWGSSLNRNGEYLTEYNHYLRELFLFIDKNKIDFDYNFRKYAYQSFVNYLFAFNGGLIRLAGRYKESYMKRLEKIYEYVVFGITHDRTLLLSLMFYVVVIASFLPQLAIMKIGQFFRKI
ncbi:MAG: glycosyltransferase [Candidatus Levybacteria bacterium]|nr:glycosyltransferase [Candidatus Levybacteria bacterium]